MPQFGKTSQDNLDTCDPRIQKVFGEIIKRFDCTILEGHRNQTRQDQMVREGKSKVKWPNGKHNTLPSQAVDAAPWPIDWKDRERFHYFAGYVVGVAASMGITLRWGGDWDRDTEVGDNSFDDLPHFEIV